MRDRKTLFKAGCGAVIITGIAAALVFNSIREKNLHQFSGDDLTKEDYEFMMYISTYGKSY
jgi:C1A family cysteine protease